MYEDFLAIVTVNFKIGKVILLSMQEGERVSVRPGLVKRNERNKALFKGFSV